MADKKENKQEIPEPVYDGSDASITFTDVVSINVRNDYVHLGIGLRDLNDPNQIKVQHKVYMTVDHFMRFSNLCGQVASNIENQIIKEQNAAKEKDQN